MNGLSISSAGSRFQLFNYDSLAQDSFKSRVCCILSLVCLLTSFWLCPRVNDLEFSSENILLSTPSISFKILYVFILSQLLLRISSDGNLRGFSLLSYEKCFRKSRIHTSSLPVTPYAFNFLSNIWWGEGQIKWRQWEDHSISTNSDYTSRDYWVTSNCVMQEHPGINSWCWSQNRLWSITCFTSEPVITDSIIFPNTDFRLTYCMDDNFLDLLILAYRCDVGLFSQLIGKHPSG